MASLVAQAVRHCSPIFLYQPSTMKILLEKQIGDGAFADVWRATDELDRAVAIKIVSRMLKNPAKSMRMV